jgi:hypothetical protein
MNRMSIFRAFRSGRFSALVALVGLGLLFTASGTKAAGCGLAFKTGAVPAIPFLSPPGNESLKHEEGEESNKHASIVGLWYVIYTATSAPPPFPTPPFKFAETYKTWHGDGTEFENAFLPPDGGNICFGVWKDLEHGSVKLHHIGLMFAGGAITNIFTVDETNTVASNGKTYTGTFHFKLFGPTNVFGTGTPILEVTGSTAGTRITVD